MPNLAEILQFLVSEPRETRTIELKSWIDLESAEGIQKIARAALALFNENGGYLVIGFNDRTCQADSPPNGIDIRGADHTDKIQKILSKYASPAFVIEVHFAERGAVAYPVIQIPAGVRTPAVCKANLSQDFSKCEVTVAASANDEELIAKAVYLLKILVRSFGDVRIPENYVSLHIRKAIFGRQSV